MKYLLALFVLMVPTLALADTTLNTPAAFSETGLTVEMRSSHVECDEAAADVRACSINWLYRIRKAGGAYVAGQRGRVDATVSFAWTDAGSDGVAAGAEFGALTWQTSGDAITLGVVTPTPPTGGAAKTVIAGILNDARDNADLASANVFN